MALWLGALMHNGIYGSGPCDAQLPLWLKALTPNGLCGPYGPGASCLNMAFTAQGLNGNIALT